MLPLTTLIAGFAYLVIEKPFFVLRRRYVIGPLETARSSKPGLAAAS